MNVYNVMEIIFWRCTMYKILKAEKLADKIYLMDVEAPRVAKSCEPGCPYTRQRTSPFPPESR